MSLISTVPFSSWSRMMSRPVLPNRSHSELRMMPTVPPSDDSLARKSSRKPTRTSRTNVPTFDSLSPIKGMSRASSSVSVSCTTPSAPSTPSNKRPGSVSIPNKENSPRNWSMMSWTFGTSTISACPSIGRPAAMSKRPCKPASVVFTLKADSEMSGRPETCSDMGRFSDNAPSSA